MPRTRKRAKPIQKRITKRVVDDHEPRPAGDLLVWDTEVRGFGLAVKPGGTKSYVYQYRNEAGRVRRYTIGSHGRLTADLARKKAKKLAGRVADGEDPQEERLERRREGTVAELAADFMKDHVEANGKPGTVRAYRQVLGPLLGEERKGPGRPADAEARRRVEHALARLGRRKVRDVTRTDLVRLHQAMRSTKILANRTLAVLRSMFSQAELWGRRDPNSNPCTGVKPFKEPKRKEKLDDEQLARLARALVELERDGPERKGRGGKVLARTPEQEVEDRRAAAAVRLILFTGCRREEVLSLRWEDVDMAAGVLTLTDAKRGPREVVLAAPALAVLQSVPKDAEHVFPGRRAGMARADGLRRPWTWVRERAALEGKRLHDLRHTFGSMGGNLNLSALMIADLLGHRQSKTAEGYVHTDVDPRRRATEKVAGALAAAMNGESGEVVAFDADRRRAD